ncbi:SGNH/GDSL hydrolase family protein [Arthrobacter sp. ERGS1:01]|uniref:SGNH/GDSL hydrolase family protein n=1 Tax=Arthrobacter sp. ERGS1:01 TaxID=1704044 RepID=UPI001364A0CE|nr:SGNH/GDSL hydrolase family protein [Arthrobacter sp. ERGS1:01]
MKAHPDLRTLAERLSQWRGRFASAISVVVVLLVVVFAADAYGSVPRVDPVATVHVDVIGDSLSTGFRTPGVTWPAEAQPLLASQGLKAQITNASENGAGYVQPGEDGDVFLDLVNRIVNSQSQVVVLFGSDNDTGDAGVAAAIQATLARVKVLAPDATVIVVGPTSESDDDQGLLSTIRESLADGAAGIGAKFVDPVALGWFQGAESTDLASDLEHPNLAGEQFLAQHMAAILAPAIRGAMQQDKMPPGRRHALELAPDAQG